MSENEPTAQGAHELSSAPLSAPLPPAEQLQFQRAEPVVELPPDAKRCVVCKCGIADTYFHAQGQIVCPACAQKIQSGTQAPATHSLLKAFLYGLGAALAGGALYAIVTIMTGFGLALIAILIGFMVGKAIRHASNGLGGRPQQILAVALTYFAMSLAYMTTGIYYYMDKHSTKTQAVESAPAAKEAPGSVVTVLLVIVGYALVAPFLALQAGIGGILNLVILFFALQRAWRMTGRHDILVMGPYEIGASPA